MNNLKQRVPFVFAEDADSAAADDQVILDDNEQEDLVSSLRARNDAANALHSQMLRGIVLLSCLLYVVLLFVPSTSPSIPYENLFSFLSIAIHLFLLKPFIKPIPFPILHALSSIAPFAALAQQAPWAVAGRWSICALVVGFAYVVQLWEIDGEKNLATLEGLKYHAPSA